MQHLDNLNYAESFLFMRECVISKSLYQILGGLLYAIKQFKNTKRRYV